MNPFSSLSVGIMSAVTSALLLGGLMLAISPSSGGDAARNGDTNAKHIREYRLQGYELRGQELQAFDLCLGMMRGQRLHNEGDMGAFCGCLAKNATEEMREPYKTNAIRVANKYIRHGHLSLRDALDLLPPDSFTGVRTGAITSIRASIQRCTQEARDASDERRHNERARSDQAARR